LRSQEEEEGERPSEKELKDPMHSVGFAGQGRLGHTRAEHEQHPSAEERKKTQGAQLSDRYKERQIISTSNAVRGRFSIRNVKQREILIQEHYTHHIAMTSPFEQPHLREVCLLFHMFCSCFV